MTEAYSQFEQLADINNLIATRATEQSSVTGEMFQRTSEVSSISEEVKVKANEVQIALAELKGVSVNIDRLAGKLKID